MSRQEKGTSRITIERIDRSNQVETENNDMNKTPLKEIASPGSKRKTNSNHSKKFVEEETQSSTLTMLEYQSTLSNDNNDNNNSLESGNFCK